MGSNKGSKAEMSWLQCSVGSPLFLIAGVVSYCASLDPKQMPHTIWLLKQSVLEIIPGKEQTLCYILWSATPA